MISPWSTNPQTTLDRPWVFRVSFLPSTQGSIVASFVSSEFQAETAAVFYNVSSEYPSDLAESFRDAAEEIGVEIVAFEQFTTGDTDFSAQLTRIVAQDPDVLFTPQYYNEVPLIVQQAREFGYDGRIVGSDAWGTPDLIDLCGNLCEGLFFSSYYSSGISTDAGRAFVSAYEELYGDTDAGRAFVSAYEERYGDEADYVAAATYDAFGLLFTAIESADSLEKAEIREALANIELFEGATGIMRYDEQGDPIKCGLITQIVDNTFNFYDLVCPVGFSPR